MKKLIVGILLSLLISNSFGQKAKDFQKQYNEAKALYANADYQRSFDGFKFLTTPHKNNEFVEVSHYYVGLSAFKMGKLLDARYILVKLEKEYPNWKDIDEARYLRLDVLLKEQKLVNAIEVLNLIKDKKLLAEAHNLFEYYVTTESWIALDSLQAVNPDDQYLAELTFKLLLAKDSRSDVERMLAMYLVQDYGLDEAQLKGIKVHSEKKEEYNVALMVPLFLNNELGAKKYFRFYEMVEGAKLAVEKLQKEGIKINLFIFDTEKSTTKVSALLNQKEFESIDLLVGPVYPKTSALGMEFSKKNNIACISPRLTDKELIEDNQNGYLWLPSEFNVAHNIYDYAKDSVKAGKVIILYSDTPEDSILANTYEMLIKEKDSMTVVKLMVRGDGIRQVRRELYYGEPNETDEAKKERNSVRRAKLSHIVVATEESIVAADLIGALELNSIDVPVFAPAKTLKINLISPDQFNRRNFIFYAPDYKVDGKQQLVFANDISKRLGLLPSCKYVHGYLGYDLLWVLGQELHKNGTSLVNTEEDSNVYDCLLTTFSFGDDHTNSYVPLIQFNDDLNFNLLNPVVNE